MSGEQPVTGDLAQTPASSQPGATTTTTTSDQQMSPADRAVAAAEAELAGSASPEGTNQGAQQPQGGEEANKTQASPGEADGDEAPRFKLDLAEADFASPEAYQRALNHAKGFDEYARKAEAKYQADIESLKSQYEPRLSQLETNLADFNLYEEKMQTPEGRQWLIEQISSYKDDDDLGGETQQGDKGKLTTEDAIAAEVDRRLKEHPAIKAYEQNAAIEQANRFADAALPVLNGALQAKYPGIGEFTKEEMFAAVAEYEAAIPTAQGTTQEQKIAGVQKALELKFGDRILEARAKAFKPPQTPPVLGGGTAPGLTPPGPDASLDERAAYAVAIAERG